MGQITKIIRKRNIKNSGVKVMNIKSLENKIQDSYNFENTHLISQEHLMSLRIGRFFNKVMLWILRSFK